MLSIFAVVIPVKDEIPTKTINQVHTYMPIFGNFIQFIDELTITIRYNWAKTKYVRIFVVSISHSL